MRFDEVVRVVRENKEARKFPEPGDRRVRDGLIFPSFRPKFPITFDDQLTLFAIGSCFARNIEDAIVPTGARIPTMTMTAPAAEKGGHANGLLNEFTPGAINQRVLSAIRGKPLSAETIVPQKDGYADLLLRSGATVTLERANERRGQIDAIYQELRKSDVVIITLGYTEAWYDQQSKLFLNRKPPHTREITRSDRYVFKRLNVDESLALLEPAVDALTSAGLKVILTVSPVAIGTTFSKDDCVVANEYSKSVLRVCVGELSTKNNVDYFPSYEIVRSGGLSSYREDNVHVKYSVVQLVTQYMINSYRLSSATGLA